MALFQVGEEAEKKLGILKISPAICPKKGTFVALKIFWRLLRGPLDS